jgi:hypothetical protein
VTSCSSAAREDGNLSFKEIEEKLAKNNDDWDACSFSTIDLVNYLYEFYDREKTSTERYTTRISSKKDGRQVEIRTWTGAKLSHEEMEKELAKFNGCWDASICPMMDYFDYRDEVVLKKKLEGGHKGGYYYKRDIVVKENDERFSIICAEKKRGPTTIPILWAKKMDESDDEPGYIKAWNILQNPALAIFPEDLKKHLHDFGVTCAEDLLLLGGYDDEEWIGHNGRFLKTSASKEFSESLLCRRETTRSGGSFRKQHKAASYFREEELKKETTVTYWPDCDKAWDILMNPALMKEPEKFQDYLNRSGISKSADLLDCTWDIIDDIKRFVKPLPLKKILNFLPDEYFE